MTIIYKQFYHCHDSKLLFQAIYTFFFKSDFTIMFEYISFFRLFSFQTFYVYNYYLMSTFSKNKEGIVFPNCKERLNFRALDRQSLSHPWFSRGEQEVTMFFSEFQISKVIASRISQGKHINYFINDYNIQLRLFFTMKRLYLPLILPGWQVCCTWSLSKTGDQVTYPNACYQIFPVQAA